MKERTYTKKDGSTGTEFQLEDGDVVTSLYNNVRSVKFGGYPSHSIKVKTTDGKEVYVKLTNGQAKRLENEGQLEGALIKAKNYTNENGTFVGVEVERLQ